MPRRISDFDWLKKRLEYLLKYVPELSEIEKGIYNDAKHWTALKIIALGYFASTYTTIIKQQPWAKQMYYIDLFAGSGLCKMENDIILGSPIAVADAARKHQFSKMFLIEKDSKKAKALDKRFEYLSELQEFEGLNYKTYSKDCNKAIPKILEEIENNKSHSLVFIDPYGMEVDWPTTKALLEIRSDIVVTLQSFLFATRALGKARKSEADLETFKRFIGAENFTPNMLDLKEPSELLQIYKENLSPYREIALDVPIRGMKSTSYYYDWIIAVKETAGGSPWIRSAKDARSRIENLDGSKVKQALRIIKGKDRDLDSFIT
jgi:three-Cys-motif partner protein